jgi:Tfp pilus assembly protein PilO
MEEINTYISENMMVIMLLAVVVVLGSGWAYKIHVVHDRVHDRLL